MEQVVTDINAPQLLATITAHYLGSNDFNGYPLREVPLERERLDALLQELVQGGLASLNLGDGHPNPYIKAFPARPASEQLEALEQLSDITHVVAYPERAHLETVLDPLAYAGRPFTLRLALGEGQLMTAFFDLSVLENYRNDPRYRYQTDDNFGIISVTDEYYANSDMAEADQVLLESFGYGYDDDMRRAVCVFLIYLSRLSPEHQQLWAARERRGSYVMHPAYYASSILGDFADRVPIFEAFIEELVQLQKMSELADLPPIIRSSFRDARPANFGFLIRPTLKELQDFHGTLDKLMSENLNKDFFRKFDIELETEAVRKKDGKTIVSPKGTIQLLQDFLAKFETEDRAVVDAAVETFREVRKLRQRIAHSADDNRFDLAFEKEQRELMIRSYQAVRTLRLVMANHPALAEYDDVPSWLDKGEIYDF